MEETITIKQASMITGLTQYQIRKILLQNNYPLLNNWVSKKDIDRIQAEHQEYISLYEYAISINLGYFDGKSFKCRNKLYEYLSKNEFFGLSVKAPEKLLSGTQQDMVFFQRQGVSILDEHLSEYFLSFGVSEEEKIRSLLLKTPGHKTTIKYLKKYREVVLGTQNISKSETDFVHLLLSIPDVTEATNSQIKELLKKPLFAGSKRHIIHFLNYVKEHEPVPYDSILLKTEKRNGFPAYSNDEYIALSTCFFNRNYIIEHDMIRKALDDHILAEMWLYLCLFFVCGWRASDICKNWHYLELYKQETCIDGITLDTLYDDILCQRISDDTYKRVCESAIIKLELSPVSASKNVSRHPLSVVISPTLKAFYGMLILIGESHRTRSKNGYMQANRKSIYQNKVNLQRLFGTEIREILHNKNILAKRLNKDFLQGVQKEGRKMGMSGIQTAMLAAYARNHNSLGSISNYLRDENLTRETAEFVLYSMLERGVFGFQKYQTLITAFPEAMLNLPMAQQTQIMNMFKATPLEIESEQSGLVVQKILVNSFKAGNEKEAISILQSMFAISQQRGKGKDNGIYCLLRSRKEACIYPSYKSCLVACCENLVFTKYGIIPLLNVLKDFNAQAVAGNKKAESILKKILIPRYQRIINELITISNMPDNEQNSLLLLMQRILTKPL